MTDALGSVAYEYDSLSRLTSELRDFSDTLANSPISGGQYELEYAYTIAGQLKSYTDAFGKTITYAQDKVGRLSTVTGTGSVTYASNPHYRAWGALSHLEYGNGTEMNVASFNNKLQATAFEVTKNTTSIIDKTYDFYADGSLKSETDANNAKFDRLFVNDFAARLSVAKSGAEARGSTDSAGNIPFGNTFGYNAFGHQISNSMKHYSSGTINLTYSYQNNRFTGSSYWDDGYDHEGNQIKDADNSYKTYKYDAANKLAGSYFIDFEAEPAEENTETFFYDGNGMLVKVHTLLEPDGGTAQNTYSYQIRSSVLSGEVITEAAGDGSRARTYIRANGTVVAWDNGSLYYSHKDPAMHSIRTTDASGDLMDFGGGGSDDRDKQELDADGRSLDFTDLYTGGGSPDLGPDMFAQGNSFGLNAGGHNTTYAVNGVSVPRSFLQTKIESGLMGGIFGLVEYTSWMSTQKRKIGEIWRTVTTPNPADAADGTIRVGMEDRFKYADVYEFHADTSWSAVGLFFYWESQKNDDFAPLPANKQHAIYNALGHLSFDLNNISKDCKEKVFDKLAAYFEDFDFKKFVDFLTEGIQSIDVARDSVNFYDGTRSQASITTVTSQQAVNILYPGSKTIADVFQNRPGQQALASIVSPGFLAFLRPGAIDTSNGGNNSRNKALIVHEGLHSFGGALGGIFDDEIQKALGITVDSKNTGNISEYIEKHCFKGSK